MMLQMGAGSAESRPLKTADLYWLAGLLEGEGCFGLQRSPVITLDMTDKDVVEKAGDLLQGPDGPIYEGRRRAGCKQPYRVQFCGSRAAGWMMTLWPLLGQRRRDRIAAILREWRSRPVQNQRKVACVRGHPFTEENTYLWRPKHRMCKQCARERNRVYARKRRSACA